MSGFPGMGMHRVRWVRGDEPEMQCWYCHEFWPITAEFWQPLHGLRRCAACLRERTNVRAKQAHRRRRAGVPEVAQAYDADRYRRMNSTLARFQRECAA